GLAVAVGVDPVGPAAVMEEVIAVPAAVAVEVVDLAGVGGVIQVPEGDQAVLVGIDGRQASGGGDLALVEPDVEVQVGVGVVDPGGDDGGRHRAGGGCQVPRFGGVNGCVNQGGQVAGVVQGELAPEERVIRVSSGVKDVVRFGKGAVAAPVVVG